MRGVHDGAVGVGNADWPGRRTFIDDGGRDSAEMGGATRVGDGRTIGRYNSGRGTYGN